MIPIKWKGAQAVEHELAYWRWKASSYANDDDRQIAFDRGCICHFLEGDFHHGIGCPIETVSDEPNSQQLDLDAVKQLYLGALGLLASCSLGLRDTAEAPAEEMRELIEAALIDAQKVFPKLRWKRTLSRIDVEVL